VSAVRRGSRDPGIVVNVVARAYGATFKIEVTHRLLPALRRALPPGTRLIPERFPGPAWVVANDEDVDRVASAAALFVAETAPGLIFVHSGAVALQNKVLLLPGRSGVGKSTLTAALVRAGATYLSDEYAAITAMGEVVPYPRALTLRATEDTPASQWPSAAMPSVASAPLPVRLIAALRYSPGADGQFALARPSATLLSLIDNTVAARVRTREMLEHCSAAVANARGLSGARGEADGVASLLLRELAVTPS
jgi:hypothetical protein